MPLTKNLFRTWSGPRCRNRRANHHLRQSLVFLNMPSLQQPEAYVGNAAQLFDASGKLVNDATRVFLGKLLDTFSSWIEKTA